MHYDANDNFEYMLKQASLEALGKKLTTEGPHKIEGTSRRVRGLLGGNYVFDTTAARYVWEHPYCPCLYSHFHSIISCVFLQIGQMGDLKRMLDPYFYIPKTAFKKGALERVDPSAKKPYWLGKLSAGGKSTDRVLAFDHAGPLEDLVRIEVSALGVYCQFLHASRLTGQMAGSSKTRSFSVLTPKTPTSE
jgi:hypothetical protein